MSKHKRKWIVVILCGVMMSLLTVFNINNFTYAEDGFKDQQETEKPMQNRYYTVVDEEGNVQFIEYEEDEGLQTLQSNDYVVTKDNGHESVEMQTYDTYEEAKEAIENVQSNTSKKLRSRAMSTYSLDTTTYDIETVADTKDIVYGVARIIGYTSYKEYDGSDKGRTGYTHGTSANDAAYIATLDDGKTIRVKQAGVFMDIPADNVEVSEYASDSKVSYYYGDNGVFRHYYYAGTYGKTSTLYSTQVGYTPDYLKNNVKYYSYDGHYFYTDYTSMIKDYQMGVNYHNRAINATQPYYNYYQYLSFRSSTYFSADDLNGLVDNAIKNNDNVDDTSKLKNQGQALLNNQEKNGINASLMLGVSINESAWGMSYYSQDRNNLFGLGAVDSNPDNAYSFDTVEECFNYFSYNTISSGYLNGMDWRYRGPHLGDKLSGVNVKYASDPYWGEKVASFSYLLNNSTNKKDYQKYQLAITNKGSLSFYQDEAFKTEIYDQTVNDTTNDQLYQYPVTILSSTTKAHKILSDTVLNTARTAQNAKGYFDINRDYVYIQKDEVQLTGSVNTSEPSDPTGPTTPSNPSEPTKPTTPEEPPAPVYLKGDVNGDGKVSSLDYIQIKNHIMKTKVLTGDSLVRADVNEDGKISSLDYIKIKNHIMGVNPLF